MSTINCHKISKKFGATTVLKTLSVDIGDGDFCFLLGPSGCGKTTLLRLIAGLENPDSGSILFDGRDVTEIPPHERRVGMVFQHYALWPHMTVEENIGFGLKVQGVPRALAHKKIGDILAMTKLIGLEKRYPHELSGGQQQRVAVGRALVLEPKILLLDEPLSNLDPALRLELRREIQSLHRALGITTLFVTHDGIEALSMATKIVVMQSGQIVEEGAPEVLYRSPRTRFVATLLGEMTFLSSRALSIEDEPPTFFGVRPEEVRVENAGDEKKREGWFSVRGSIQSQNFLGAHRKLTVAVSPHETFSLIVSSSESTFIEGEEKIFSFPQKALIPFRDRDSA